MIPALIVPVLNRPELLEKMLESIDYSIKDRVIIDNGDVIDPGYAFNMRCRLIKPGHNLGVSASWNLGMKTTPWAPWWLIVNSDIEFGPGDLAKLDSTVTDEADDLFFMLGMAAFAVTRNTVSKVGYFDENFHPAYDEDIDYQRRASLAGSGRVEVGFTGTHVGSATIYADERIRAYNAFTHPRNDLYYARKWGGHKQGGETFTTPFNLGGHLGDWRLDPERLAEQGWPKEKK